MRTLRRGDVGQDVAEWQRVVGVDPDGAFGALTEAATKRWQVVRGLASDGVVGPITRKAANLPEPEQPKLLRGVDVSVVQGIVPWDRVKAEGCDFAIMRCAVGNEPRGDVRFAENVARATAAGLVVGGYCFVFPLPHLDARAQARHHVRLLERLGAIEGELAPIADLEWPPREEWKAQPDGTKALAYPWRRWGCSAGQIAEWCLTYLDEAHRLTGLHWGRYTYRYWAACVGVGDHPEFDRGPLVLADYWASGRVPTPEEVAGLRPLAPWPAPTIIQHDGNGGLRLPNGADADFNVLIGGLPKLRELSPGSVSWTTPPEVVATAVVHGAQGDGEPITEADIRAYRVSRLTDVPIPTSKAKSP